MTIHRCPLPEQPPATGMRMFQCPDCDARYLWSKRMVGRQMKEGWWRSGFSTPAMTGLRTTTDDPELSWFKRWFALIAVGYAIGFLVVISVIVWIVLRLTA